MDYGDILFGPLMIVLMFLVFALGGAYAQPDELENGCIVHNDKVYCEEVNKGEE